MVELPWGYQYHIRGRNHYSGTVGHYPCPGRYPQKDYSVQRLSITSCVCGPHWLLALTQNYLTNFVQRGNCHYLSIGLRERYERIG